MANTYTQIFIQIIFSVRNREPLINEHIRPTLQKYITGIIQDEGSKVLAIYSNPVHIHILISMNPALSLSTLVQKIKSHSTKFINHNGWMNDKFSWQEGYGAFSYSKSQVDKVIQYILDQPEHHKKITFKEEYLKFSKEFDVPYNPKYVFLMA